MTLKTKRLGIIVILISVILFGAKISTAAPPPDKGNPIDSIWAVIDELNNTIIDLQNQIDNIQLIPGPQGDPGQQGPAGPQGPIGPEGPPGTGTRIVTLKTGDQRSFSLTIDGITEPTEAVVYLQINMGYVGLTQIQMTRPTDDWRSYYHPQNYGTSYTAMFVVTLTPTSNTVAFQIYATAVSNGQLVVLIQEN